MSCRCSCTCLDCVETVLLCSPASCRLPLRRLERKSCHLPTCWLYNRGWERGFSLPDHMQRLLEVSDRGMTVCLETVWKQALLYLSSPSSLCWGFQTLWCSQTRACSLAWGKVMQCILCVAVYSIQRIDVFLFFSLKIPITPVVLFSVRLPEWSVCVCVIVGRVLGVYFMRFIFMGFRFINWLIVGKAVKHAWDLDHPKQPPLIRDLRRQRKDK